MKKLHLGREAITKMQAVVIAVIIIVAVVAGAALYYFSIPPPAPEVPDKILIGASLSLTGGRVMPCKFAHTDIYPWIVGLINDEGGLYIPEYDERIPIELKIYDDGSDIEAMLKNYEKLITEDKVDYILPPWGTDFTVASFSVAEKYKIPMVGTTAESKEAADKWKYGEFNYGFLAGLQPDTIAVNLVDLLEHLGIDRIGIIHASTLFAVECSASVYAYAFGAGIEIAIYKSYPADVGDLSPLIKELQDLEVENLVAMTYPSDGMLFISQCIELNYCPRFLLMGPGACTPPIILGTYTPEQAKGICIFHGEPLSAYDTPEAKAWAEEHKQSLGTDPGPQYLHWWAAYEAYFEAIERYGLDREKVRDALATETFDTIMGEIRFIAGVGMEASGGGYIAQWQGGPLMEVIWPTETASASWIPKTSW